MLRLPQALVLTITAVVSALTSLLDNSMLSLAALFDDEIQQCLQIGIGLLPAFALLAARALGRRLDASRARHRDSGRSRRPGGDDQRGKV